MSRGLLVRGRLKFKIGKRMKRKIKLLAVTVNFSGEEDRA